MFGDGEQPGATASRRCESRERNLSALGALCTRVARNGGRGKNGNGNRRWPTRVRNGRESANDEIESEHDASQCLSPKSLPRFPNRAMADRLLCEARRYHAGWRKPERFRRQDGSAKYPDEKWEPRPGWIGRCRLRRRTQP